MDYHSLKRRELQALCKEHNIPANSANSVLADKLSALLNENQKPITRQRTCMKTPIEGTVEGEPAALKRQAKKVRFSPSNDLVEYELRSGEKQKDMVTRIKARRKSVAKKVDKPVVDNNTTVELVDDSARIPVKLTRSRVQLSGKDVVIPNNEKKQTRRVAKSFEKGTVVDKETEGNVREVTRSKAHTLKRGGGVQSEESRHSKRLIEDVEKAGESVDETVVSRARVTRSKAQTLMEGGTGPDVNPHVRKKSVKQVETDGQNVEPSKEIMDIPVRATRSRRQTLKEDIGNAVTNLQVDKKRSRREMKATDLSSNSNHVAPVDKKVPRKRKSSRTRGMEAVDEVEGDKVGVVNDGRVTRSKAPLAMEVSGRNSRNTANKVGIQQIEEPSKHASKKNVNRRKSVLRPEKTEVIIHLEEPVNRPARKNTRQNSITQKATKMVESPTVGKKQSKGQSGKLSMIKGLEDKENVTRSGKDAFEDEFKEAYTGSPKSRKRRGTPIIDDQIIETEYGSLVDKSPKSSTHSDRKSDGKSVAKMQAESSLKKSMSRMKNQSSVENSSKGKSWAIRSGAIIRDGSSKKRTKLSGTKQSDSEDHDVNSSKEVTPVGKMGNFKLDDEVTQPEVTPTLDKFDRRFTRSAIRSERKEQGQSAIKEQPIAGIQLSSVKVAKFRPDPAVNTAPGRITRRGIKHGGNAAGSFSEKVGKKKQTSQSAQKKQFLDDAQKASPEVAEVVPNPGGVSSEIEQPLDEAQMFSPEVAEVGPNPDVDTIGVRPEYKQPYDTPVAKMGNFKLDDEVTQPEVTPAIDKFDRRFTRSAIRSERKEPTQSAIKEQPIAGTQLSSAKVAKFRLDPTVNTAPGRITRRGINAAGGFSEKVGKKKQTSQSAHKKQSLDDAQKASPEVAEVVPNPEGVSSEIEQSLDEAQMFSPEVAEVGPNPDVNTIGVRPEYKQPYDDVQVSSPEVAEVLANPDSDTVRVGFETSREVTGQMLGDLSASESVSLPTIVVENRDTVSGTAVDMDSASLVSGENASGEVMEDANATPCLTENLLSGKQQNPLELQSFDDGPPSGKFSRIRMTSVSMADVAKTLPDAVSDGSHVQNRNEEVYVESGIFGEAVNLETSVLESGRPDAKEKETESTESGSTSKGLQTDVMTEEPLVSVGKAVILEESVDISSLGISTKGNNVDDDHNCDSISYDVGSPAVRHASIQQSDVADDGEQYDEDESANDQKPLMSEPVSEDRGVAVGVEAQEMDSLAGDYDDVPNTDDTLGQLTVNNKLQGHDMEDADDTGKHPAKELEFEVVPSTHNNIHDIPILGKSDGEDGSFNAIKESETDSMPSRVCNMIQDPLLSGNDCEDEGDTTNKEHESNPEPLPDIDASPMGKDDFSIPRQLEPILEPSSANDITVIPFLGNDVNGGCDNATIFDRKSRLDMFGTPLIDKGYVADDGDNAPKELETGSELSNASNLEDNNNAQDGESGHDQLTSNDNLATDEEDLGGDDLEPPQNKSMPVVTEVLVRSCDQEPEQILNVAVDDVLCETVGQSDSVTDKDTLKTPATCGNDDMVVRVDALEESVLDINKDVVSSILGDIYDMDADDDRGNEKGSTESDEGFQPKEIRGVSSITRESLPITYKKEESPVDDTDSDLPTVKEDDKNKQEETSVDLGGYDFGMDEFENPADRSVDMVGKGKKDDQDADIHTSARTSSSIEETSGLEAGLSNSVRNSEVNSQNVADGKSNQEVDMLKESAKTTDVTQEVFNWSDSSLKSLFATPVATRVSCVKDSQEDTVNLANQDTYSSLKPLFATPSTTQISHVKDGQMDAVSFANQDPYSSLKSYATTPVTTQTSHVNDAQEDAVNFANKDHYSSLKSLFTTPASSRTSHVNDSKADAVNFSFPAGRSNKGAGATGTAAPEFNHQWEDDHSKVLDGEAHGSAVRGPANDMYGVPSFEDDPLKLFGDEEVGGSFDTLGRNSHFEFKGDQVDEIKQFEFEAAGTSHLDPSGLKDNPIRSGEIEKKEETLIEGSETDNGLAFGTGK